MTNDPTEATYFKAVTTMFSGLTVQDGMNALATSLEPVVPTGFGAELIKLGAASEQPVFNTWLSEQLARHPTRVDVLWFSLSDLGAEISLCLLRQRDVPKDDLDWKAHDHLASVDVPGEILQPLHAFLDAASPDALDSESTRWIAETCIPLAWSGLMVAKAMHELPLPTLLGEDARRRVAVFFAEGDDFLLGEVAPRGFRFVSPPAGVSG